jgi:dihydrofolate reductase
LIVSLIVAMDERSGIGKNNQLPWHLSSDLKRFKKLTMGHFIVMGRKTHESIGRTLPGRSTIVLTRQENFQSDNCLIAHSLDEAIQLAEKAGESELFIIGGGEVFSQAIDRADKIYLTSVHTEAKADVFFPWVDPSVWEMTSKESYAQNGQDDHDSTFKIFQRRA